MINDLKLLSLIFLSVGVAACKGHPVKEKPLKAIVPFENTSQAAAPSISCPKPSIISYTAGYTWLENADSLNKLKGQYHLVKADIYSKVEKNGPQDPTTNAPTFLDVGTLYTQIIFNDTLDNSLPLPTCTCSARSDTTQAQLRFASEFGRVLDFDQGTERDRVYINNSLQPEGWVYLLKDSRISEEKMKEKEVSRHIQNHNQRGESLSRYFISTDERELIVQKYFKDPLTNGGFLTFHLRLVYQLQP